MPRTLIMAFAATAMLTVASEAQDIQAGQQVFKKCRSCHEIGPGAKNKVGPILNGLFGRPAGTIPGYSYSDANKTSGIVWTEDVFAEYIRNPRGFLPGTKMPFTGLKKDADVTNIIAYIGQFQADGSIQPAQ